MGENGSRRLHRGCALALALAGLVASRAAIAQEAFLPPTGGLIDGERLRPAPASREPRVCSLRHPICVHGSDASVPPDALLALVAAAERAWDVESGPLELPAPDPDLVTGAYDLYV